MLRLYVGRTICLVGKYLAVYYYTVCLKSDSVAGGANAARTYGYRAPLSFLPSAQNVNRHIGIDLNENHENSDGIR